MRAGTCSRHERLVGRGGCGRVRWVLSGPRFSVLVTYLLVRRFSCEPTGDADGKGICQIKKMGANSSSSISELLEKEYLKKLAGAEPISENDPFWNQLLSQLYHSNKQSF
ncbi:hypothetical protein AV530_014727 [Patagioenas fasciata monilis]|uniref:Dymeclin n=1 Tax=Patagioenas fasciata monilis TaxID=372326 RepID=A0A1V4KPM3_PATFA|nr:hypothetical protein AV530_014727 [Patagioenas fasciata monilis]